MASADWDCYRLCPTCRVATGTPCKSLSGKVVNGHPDGCETTLDEPHHKRPLRSYRTAAYSTLVNKIRAEARRRASHADA